MAPSRASTRISATAPTSTRRPPRQLAAGAVRSRLDDEQWRRRMITKFGSLYAGHVDFDDLGFDATPANDRWLSDERLAGVFDKALAIAQVMDRNGYDTFWMAEHHFQREGYE